MFTSSRSLCTSLSNVNQKSTLRSKRISNNNSRHHYLIVVQSQKQMDDNNNINNNINNMFSFLNINNNNNNNNEKKNGSKTEMRRGTADSDDTKGRAYLVAPPPLFPLVPAFKRQTYRYEIEKGKMWFFEQKQGIGLGLNVSVNVRMTVIKLKSGGLWVHAPVAPTKECIALLNELDAPVEHIILPTTLFEHKIFVGPFSRKFPQAKLWITQDQWSWPVNLPPKFFGIDYKKNGGGILGDVENSPKPSWADEFEIELLIPPALGVASYVSFIECAFFHKPSRTLLVTDSVVYVSENIPDAVLERDLMESGDDGSFTITALKLLNLFDIREKAKLRTNDSSTMTIEEKRRLGWQRNALQALYFGPNNLLDPEESWKFVTNRLFVAPVVATLVYENVPDNVNDWVKRVSKWNFTRIVPCHFDAPIKAGPKEFREAFRFLPSSRVGESSNNYSKRAGKDSSSSYFNNEDMVLLRAVADFLKNTGVIFTNESRPKKIKVLTNNSSNSSTSNSSTSNSSSSKSRSSFSSRSGKTKAIR
jgi:hypothetical protein